ncbi:MAG: Calx-beta domain-containing protein [Steroidobacteraceae bacterium]
MLQRTLFVVAGLTLACAHGFAARLDPAFGTAGRAIIDVGASVAFSDAVLQPDGKTIVVGRTPAYDWTGETPKLFPREADFLVLRVNPDGALDETFANHGQARIDFAGEGDDARAVTLQNDGKILVAGAASMPDSLDVALVRLNADGSPDATFGNGGKVTRNFPLRIDGPILGFEYSNPANSANKLAVQASGRIVVRITSWISSSDHRASYIRFLPDGTLDTDFGVENGQVPTRDTTNMLAGPAGEIIGATELGTTSLSINALDTDGRVASTLFSGSLPYPRAGDTAFVPSSLRRLPNGGFVGSGTVLELSGATALKTRSFVFRTTADGLIDASFANSGWAEGINGSFDNDTYDLQREPGGKLISAGRGGRTIEPTSPFDFTIVRLKEDGQVDLSFAETAVLSIPLDEGNTMLSAGTMRLLRRPDGRLLVAGERGRLDAPSGSSTNFLRSLQADTRQIVLAQVISTPEFSFDATTVRINEANATATVSVRRKGETSNPVSIEYSTSPGSATAGSDYTTTSGTLTWQPTDPDSKTITIPILADSIDEPDESFTVKLSNPSEGTLVGDTATVTIAASNSSGTGNNGGNTGTGKGGGGALGEELLPSLVAFLALLRRRRMH